MPSLAVSASTRDRWLQACPPEVSAHAAAQAAYHGIMEIYDRPRSAHTLSSILMQSHLAMADPAQKVAASLSFENGAYAAQAVDNGGPPKQLLSG